MRIQLRIYDVTHHSSSFFRLVGERQSVSPNEITFLVAPNVLGNPTNGKKDKSG